MKQKNLLIAVSQRMDFVGAYNETRDSIDQRWIEFLKSCSLIPILMPNNMEATLALLNSITIHGVLLTGGNRLPCCGSSDAPARDNVEKELFQYALDNALPTLGVCRGMQFLLNNSGVPLKKVSNHVGKYHEITTNSGKRFVNSYHDFAALEISDNFYVEATSADGVIEAISHKYKKIAGIMWHPEREKSFHPQDQNFVKSFFYET